jgi:hypothetical protein
LLFVAVITALQNAFRNFARHTLQHKSTDFFKKSASQFHWTSKFAEFRFSIVVVGEPKPNVKKTLWEQKYGKKQQG